MVDQSRPTVDADVVFDGWTQGHDGVWERRAARVIAVDASGWLLLLRGVDPADPTHTWWFTPGGGVERAEDERTAAARELLEESGLAVTPDELVGPVAERTAEFPYFGRRCRQTEVLFFVRVDGEVSTSGWTDVERASVTDVRWQRLDEVATLAEPVYPAVLPELVRELTTTGWDGRRRTID